MLRSLRPPDPLRHPDVLLRQIERDQRRKTHGEVRKCGIPRFNAVAQDGGESVLFDVRQGAGVVAAGEKDRADGGDDVGGEDEADAIGGELDEAMGDDEFFVAGGDGVAFVALVGTAREAEGALNGFVDGLGALHGLANGLAFEVGREFAEATGSGKASDHRQHAEDGVESLFAFVESAFPHLFGGDAGVVEAHVSELGADGEAELGF